MRCQLQFGCNLGLPSSIYKNALKNLGGRRYSDNPQSGRPSTSLALLGICRNSRNWEKIGGGRGVACIESTLLIQAARWSRGVLWSGKGHSGHPVRSDVPPAPEKLQRRLPPIRLQHSCTAPTPDFRDLVRRLSNWYCPQAYSTAVTRRRRPDCALSE